ncbi:MAG: prepilin peptidase, partial [bacterium]
MEIILLAILGAIFGSFLNVVIYRLPRSESVISPSSRCPACTHRLKPWENIPVLSYLFLRGKCSSCHTHIPIRYLIVELLTPLCFIANYLLFGFSLSFFKFTLLILMLIPITFIDIDHKLILDKLTLPGILAGLLFSIIQNPALFYQPFLGILVGGGVLWLIAIIGRLVYKRESMGGGDIKLGAMIGAFINVQLLLLSFFLAFFIAALFAVVGMMSG